MTNQPTKLSTTYGMNAWYFWVKEKNIQLEKAHCLTVERDILKIPANELDYTLSLFVKEVRNTNGNICNADSILYFVMGIQKYLFENDRMDNIFTDTCYDAFTTALHEVIKEFKLPINDMGYPFTRIEEEHLWETKQLGVHSPQVSELFRNEIFMIDETWHFYSLKFVTCYDSSIFLKVPFF